MEIEGYFWSLRDLAFERTGKLWENCGKTVVPILVGRYYREAHFINRIATKIVSPTKIWE